MQISKSEIRLVWGGEPKVGLRPGAGRSDPPTSSLGHTPRGRCPELNSHHGCRISSPRLWAFASPSPHISAPASGRGRTEMLQVAGPTPPGVFAEKGLAVPSATRLQVQGPRQSLFLIFLGAPGEKG